MSSVFRIPNPEELYARRGSVTKVMWASDGGLAHVVLDLETLGTNSHAPIVSIGAIGLDRHYVPIGYFASGPISIGENIEAERKVDAGTLLWWMQQSGSAKEYSFGGDQESVCLYYALEEFCEWADFARSKAKVWGNGPEFDAVIFENAMRAYPADPADPLWNFGNVQSLRTIRLLNEELGLGVKWVDPVIKHVALYDAYAEAMFLHGVMAEIHQRGMSSLPAYSPDGSKPLSKCRLRVMISQPMRGKTTEQIRAERADLVAKLESYECEVADTIFPAVFPDDADPRIWRLGKATQELARCDVLVMMPGWEGADGCVVEFTTAKRYGLAIWYAEDTTSWAYPEAENLPGRIQERKETENENQD